MWVKYLTDERQVLWVYTLDLMGHGMLGIKGSTSGFNHAGQIIENLFSSYPFNWHNLYILIRLHTDLIIGPEIGSCCPTFTPNIRGRKASAKLLAHGSCFFKSEIHLKSSLNKSHLDEPEGSATFWWVPMLFSKYNIRYINYSVGEYGEFCNNMIILYGKFL